MSNLPTELVALAIRNLPSNSKTVYAPSTTSSFLDALFSIETPEERQARELVETATKIVALAKRVSTNRKFKKIVKNV